MATPNVLMINEFQASSLAFSSLEKNRQGGKQVFVSREGFKNKIVLQTPAVHLPFGITPYQDANTGNVLSWSMDVSFKESPEFLEAMRQVDTALVDVATARSADWFGKPMPREVVSEFTRPLVRDPKNPQYAPTMKIKVPCVNGNETTKFYDERRQPVPMEYVTKGTTVRVIMELSPVWFLNKNLGVSWKALQVAVVSRPRVIEDYAFVGDAVEEDVGDGAGDGAGDDGKSALEM